MWNVNGNNDLDNYFKIIEEEAKELREQKPLGSKETEPKFSGGHNYGGNSNYGRGFNYDGGSKFDWSKKEPTYQPKTISNYNPENDPSTIFYGNYAKNHASQNGNSSGSDNAGGHSYLPSNEGRNSSYIQPPSVREDLYQVPSNYGSVSNVQQIEAQLVSEAVEDPHRDDSVVPRDPDGYKLTDFNRCFFTYTDSPRNIRHIFLTVFQRDDLMEYTSKIMECTSQDQIVLSIQRDNQLAEAFAAKLRSNGFWATEITNKTQEPEKLAEQHSVYRCIVTTMAFLRDNSDMFKRPSVIMNFDHSVIHVKFLERWINYRNTISPPPAGVEIFIYEMCFQSSTASQELKEYIQNKMSSN